MSATKWTPGPWLASQAPTSIGSAIRLDAANNRICTIYLDGIRPGIDDALPRAVEGFANAHLIAASPRLYATLEALVKEAESPFSEAWVQEHCPEIIEARAALAAARGE